MVEPVYMDTEQTSKEGRQDKAFGEKFADDTKRGHQSYDFTDCRSLQAQAPKESERSVWDG